MSPPLWVRELADSFWNEVGQPEPFPRTLTDSLPWLSFSVTIKEKPSLGIDMVENYLAHLGSRWRCGEADRPLHACLVAYQGAAWIFLDSQDEPCERTYSLAHELAHFLRHYRQPRQQAVKDFGPSILEVFDGLRPARREERLHFLLGGRTAGVHVHLMDRSEVYVSPAIAQAEDEADLLAWELLAPADEVFARLGPSAEFEQAVSLLVSQFGLPVAVAEDYADFLFPEEEDAPVVLSLKKILEHLSR